MRIPRASALWLLPALAAAHDAAPALDCRALYARRAALMRARLDHHPAFRDDPRHGAAGCTGTVLKCHAGLVL